MTPSKLGALLVAKGLITPDQLQSAIELQSKEKSRLSSSLVKLGHVNEKVLITFLSTQYGLEATSLSELDVSRDVLRLVPKTLCLKHKLIPISVQGSRIKVALSDPTNISAVDDVRFITNLEVEIALATESEVLEAVERLYSQDPDGPVDSDSGTFGDPVRPGESGFEEIANFQEDSAEETNTSVAINPTAEAIDAQQIDSKPVIKLINKLFLEAIRKKVSDIHIEPYEKFSRVRFRIDGSLHEVIQLPLQFRLTVPARIKVMAHLDIAEKRLPQDGRLQVRTKERAVDVRVSLVPTLHGEKVVLRLLDQGGNAPEVSQVGMEPNQLELFKKAAEQPYGMVLVTGPTGSGKTTTLYAALSSLNSPDVNISTAEDPVEYTLLGINQVHVKESIGMTFAGALRSFLRQDPDIIMVGEIRDQETAEIAVKAALTGHMVFSTLHTNDASSTNSRLRHMGPEPFLITAAVSLVQAQRLVRILCSHCKVPDPAITQEILRQAEMPEELLAKCTPMKAKGCERCGGTGFKGRKGIFEVLAITEEIRNLIIKGANSDDIKRVAVAGGMLTLRQSGNLKLLRGETTLHEVLNNSRPDGELVKL